MNLFNESARVAINKRIENAGETHLCCALLLDTSSSMDQDKLNEAVRAFTNAIREDPLVMGRVEFAVITYDDDARIIEPFGSAYDLNIPHLETGGMTAGHAARSLALKAIEQRKDEYKKHHVPYYRPWIFDLTDGCPNDSPGDSPRNILEAQKNNHVLYFPVAIGDYADIAFLKSIQKDGFVLTSDIENFRNSFLWFSASISEVVRSQPKDVVCLPSPSDYQLTVVV